MGAGGEIWGQGVRYGGRGEIWGQEVRYGLNHDYQYIAYSRGQLLNVHSWNGGGGHWPVWIMSHSWNNNYGETEGNGSPV